MDPSTFDAEQHRNLHESDREWGLRREFLVKHCDKFTEDRLVCLANCFINMKIYGAKYPTETMSTVNELAQQIQDYIDDYDSSSRSGLNLKQQIKFVKASSNSSDTLITNKKNCIDNNSDNMTFLESTETYNSEEKPSNNRQQQTQFKYGMRFVKSSTAYESTDLSKQKEESLESVVQETPNHFRELENHFYILAACVKGCEEHTDNPIQTLHMAMDKAKMKQTCHINPGNTQTSQPQFVCDLEINFVHVARAVSTNKKTAKLIAFSDAISLLKDPNLKIIEKEGGMLTLTSADQGQKDINDKPTKKYQATFAVPSVESNEQPGQQFRGQKRGYEKVFNLEQFIIIEHVNSDNQPQILRHSADFNKHLLVHDFTDAGPGMVRCQVLLNGQLMADVTDVTKTSVKAKASEQVMDTLRQTCWVIRIKSVSDCQEGDQLSRDDLLGELQAHSDRITDSNIGNQMLQKMGWSGGGLGKKGTGISNPVGLEGVVINRQGLGLQTEQGISRQFLPMVKKMLSDYVRSTDGNDLAFSPEFNKDERAIIHKECRKLGLKSGSRGKDEERYLIISRKRSPQQLLQHVLDNGGSTNKYTVMPPGSYSKSH